VTSHHLCQQQEEDPRDKPVTGLVNNVVTYYFFTAYKSYYGVECHVAYLQSPSKLDTNTLSAKAEDFNLLDIDSQDFS